MNAFEGEKPDDEKTPSYLDDIAKHSEGVPEIVVDMDRGVVLINGKVVIKVYRVPRQADIVMAFPIEDLAERPGCQIIGKIGYYCLDTGKKFYELKRYSKTIRELSPEGKEAIISNIY